MSYRENHQNTNGNPWHLRVNNPHSSPSFDGYIMSKISRNFWLWHAGFTGSSWPIPWGSRCVGHVVRQGPTCVGHVAIGEPHGVGNNGDLNGQEVGNWWKLMNLRIWEQCWKQLGCHPKNGEKWRLNSRKLRIDNRRFIHELLCFVWCMVGDAPVS
jgi:hypothetical protein